MRVSDDSSQTSQLIDQAVGGNEQAINALIDKYRLYLRKLIDLRMDDALRQRVDPSDLVQETQVVAAKRIDDFLRRRPTSFRIWLRRKALEQIVDARRRHIYAEKRSVRREYRLSDQSSMALAGLMIRPTKPSITNEDQMIDGVRNAIDHLKPNDREVLLLRHVEELSNVEAAEVLGVDPKTASKRYGRALRRIRERLAERGFFDEQ